MAGLGETYTHIAVILFYLEATVKVLQLPVLNELASGLFLCISRELNIYLRQLWERKGK